MKAVGGWWLAGCTRGPHDPLAPSLPLGLPASVSVPQANIGQKEDFEEARKKALKLGAKKVRGGGAWGWSVRGGAWGWSGVVTGGATGLLSPTPSLPVCPLTSRRVRSKVLCMFEHHPSSVIYLSA